MRRTNLHTRLLLIIMAVTLLSAGTIAGYAFYLQHTARAILKDVSALQVGKSTFHDAEIIANRYKRRVSTERSVRWRESGSIWDRTACDSVGCQFNIRVSNSKLATFKLVDKAEFEATIEVRHDRVTFVSATVFGGRNRTVGGGTYYSDNAELDQITRGSEYKTWVPRPDSAFKVITNRASADQKQWAFELQVSCLTNFTRRGCNSVTDYVPLSPATAVNSR